MLLEGLIVSVSVSFGDAHLICLHTCIQTDSMAKATAIMSDVALVLEAFKLISRH